MTRIDINHAAIQQFATSPSGPVYRLVQDVAEHTQRVARQDAPVARYGRTAPGGSLRDSIDVSIASEARGVKARVGSPLSYAAVQDRGRGTIVVGRARRSKTGKFTMTFQGARDGKFISMKAGSVIAGVPATLFLETGLESATKASPVEWRVAISNAPHIY